MKSKVQTKVFGLFEFPILAKINKKLLKPLGLKFKVKTNYRQWGDQVEITIEKIK